MKKENTPFNQNLRLYRERAHISIDEMVKTLNLAKSTYSQYETANREPPYFILLKIVSVLHCTIDELLGHEYINQDKLINLLRQYDIDVCTLADGSIKLSEIIDCDNYKATEIATYPSMDVFAYDVHRYIESAKQNTRRSFKGALIDELEKSPFSRKAEDSLSEDKNLAGMMKSVIEREKQKIIDASRKASNADVENKKIKNN